MMPIRQRSSSQRTKNGIDLCRETILSHFYQLCAAPDKAKEKIWPGLVGCTSLYFPILGCTKTKTIEGLTDGQRWQQAFAALHTIGIQEDSMIKLMRAIVVVLQLGYVFLRRS